jgi:hypothetical protein
MLKYCKNELLTATSGAGVRQPTAPPPAVPAP